MIVYMYRKFFFLLALVPCLVGAQSEPVYIEALVPGCGNGVVEVGESCDGSNLAGNSCATIGFHSGTLSCSSLCTFVTTSCQINNVSQSSSATLPKIRSEVAKTVVIEGLSSPRSMVYVLSNGIRVAQGMANESGYFQIPVARSTKNQHFSIVVETPSGLRGGTFAFTLPSFGEGVFKVSDLFVGPSIDVTQSLVSTNSRLDIFGEAVPGSIIHTVLYRDGVAVRRATTTASQSGIYNVALSTSYLAKGVYTILSYSELNSQMSAPSRVMSVNIGNFDMPRYRDFDTCAFVRGDVNKDCRVNWADISILYQKGKWQTASGLIELEALSGDGKINMTDISIIMYNWTG